MTKRSISMVLAGVLALGVLAGCGSKPKETYTKDQAPATQAAKLAPLKIGQLPVVDGMPFWVAAQNNYFKNAGLDVELITFNSANERDAALVSGDIDGTLTDPLGATTLAASGTKVKITSIGLGATQAEGPMAILASPKSNITKVEDLKGVEVAIATNTVTHYVAEKLLLENGFKPEEIKFTSVPQIPLRMQLLADGQIKAAVLPDPLASLVAKEGAKIVVSDAKAKSNYSLSVIVFSEKAIAEKTASLKAFFAGYNMAVADIQAQPDKYMDVLITNAKLDPKVKDAYKIVPPSFAQAPKKEDLESVVQWLVDKKIIANKLTYEQLVDDSMLPKK